MKIYHGNILTCNEKNEVCQYLVEDEGIILYVGDELPLMYKEKEMIELKEEVLIPSFVDTHLHFASMSMFQSGLNVMSATSNEEIMESLKEYVPKAGAKIVIAFGASPHSVKEQKLLSREQLDHVSMERPIMVVKYDGHACIINTALIKMLPEKIKNMRGYDAQTGEMNQDAFFAVTDFVSSTIPTKELIKSMQRSIDYMASVGVGMIHTVSGVGFPKDMDVDIERFIGKSAESGFQMRLFFQTMDVKKVEKRKLPRIGGCFITALDGCFGSVDAALHQPYEGSDDQGVLYYTDEHVTAFCKQANRAGLQIELHAIGDAAFDQATRCIKAALDDYPRDEHRHGIIHACLPTEEGLDICEKYHIQLPVQSAFIDWPQEPDAYLEEILGERANRLNPLRQFFDRGIDVSFGSDAPCTDPDPMMWIYKACNHSVVEESLTVEEALRAATYNGYKATFDEKERGSLETGKIADMVLLSQNPYTVDKKELKDIQVKKLYLQGKEYQKQKQHWLSAVLKGFVSKRGV